MCYFNERIPDVLVRAAKLFSTAQGIADYFDISMPTLYGWVRTYHNLSFRQFKRKYVCAVRKCIVIDYGSGKSALKYNVADRIYERGGCACFVEGGSSFLMTSLTAPIVADAMRSEVAFDADAGIYYIRYPVHPPRNLKLPSVALSSDDYDAEFGVSELQEVVDRYRKG